MRAVLVTINIYIAYLVLVNVALESGLAKKIANRSPDKFLFEYTSAYSLWPGSMHAKNFVFRGHDSVVEWRFAFDEASVHFALTELPSKRAHLTHGWAKGVDIRVRRKLDPIEAGAPSAAWLPPIDGFADPPIKGASVPDPPDSAYPYVTMDMENIVGEDVRQVWIDTIRAQDVGSLRGGFYFKPMRRVLVKPTQVTLRSATVTEGGVEIVRDLQGDATLAVDGLDPRTIELAALLESIHAKTNIDGLLPSLAFLSSHMAPTAFSGGHGPFHIEVALENGNLQAASRINAHVDDWHVTAGKTSANGSSHVVLNVDEAQILHVDAETTNARFDSIHAKYVGAIVKTTNTLARSADEAAVSIEIPDAHADLSKLADDFERGHADLSVHVDYQKSIANVRSRITATDALVRVQEKPFAFDAIVNLNLVGYRTSSGTGDLSGTSFELHEPKTDWWGRGTIGPGKLERNGADVTLTAKARNADPVWTIIGVPGWVRGLLGGSDLTIVGHAKAGPSGVALSDLHAVGNGFEVLAAYDSGSKSGRAWLERGPITAGVLVTKGAVSVTPLASRAWYRDQVGTSLAPTARKNGAPR